MPLPKGEHGTSIDIDEPAEMFNHDVTLLDIINILDKEVALQLYKEDKAQAGESEEAPSLSTYWLIRRRSSLGVRY